MGRAPAGADARMTAPRISLPWPLRLSAVLMAVLFAAWCALLAPQWLGDANLTHGLFMPVVLAALLYEGARSGSTRYLPDTPAVDVLQAAVALGGLLTGLAGGSFAALMGWDHSLADFLLTLGMAGLLLALPRRRPPLRPLRPAAPGHRGAADGAAAAGGHGERPPDPERPRGPRLPPRQHH